MEKLTRYEFGGTGIFNAIDILYGLDLDDQEKADLKWAEKEFDTTLKSPDVFDDEAKTNKLYCFFTPKGESAFASCLDILTNLFYQAEDAGLGEFQSIVVSDSDLNIVYRDDYQVVASLSFQKMENIRRMALQQASSY